MATIAHLRAKLVFLNSSQVSKRFFFSIGQGQLTPQSMVGPFLTSIKGRTSVANLHKKMMLYNPNLINDNGYT